MRLDHRTRCVLRRKTPLIGEALRSGERFLRECSRTGVIDREGQQRIKNCRQESDRVRLFLEAVESEQLNFAKLIYTLERSGFYNVADELAAELAWESNALDTPEYVRHESRILTNSLGDTQRGGDGSGKRGQIEQLVASRFVVGQETMKRAWERKARLSQNGAAAVAESVRLKDSLRKYLRATSRREQADFPDELQRKLRTQTSGADCCELEENINVLYEVCDRALSQQKLARHESRKCIHLLAELSGEDEESLCRTIRKEVEEEEGEKSNRSEEERRGSEDERRGSGDERRGSGDERRGSEDERRGSGNRRNGRSPNEKETSGGGSGGSGGSGERLTEPSTSSRSHRSRHSSQSNQSGQSSVSGQSSLLSQLRSRSKRRMDRATQSSEFEREVDSPTDGDPKKINREIRTIRREMGERLREHTEKLENMENMMKENRQDCSGGGGKSVGRAEATSDSSTSGATGSESMVSRGKREDDGGTETRRNGGKARESEKDRYESEKDRYESGKDRYESGKDRYESGKDRYESGRGRDEGGREGMENGEGRGNLSKSRENSRREINSEAKQGERRKGRRDDEEGEEEVKGRKENIKREKVKGKFQEIKREREQEKGKEGKLNWGNEGGKEGEGERGREWKTEGGEERGKNRGREREMKEGREGGSEREMKEGSEGRSEGGRRISFGRIETGVMHVDGRPDRGVYYVDHGFRPDDRREHPDNVAINGVPYGRVVRDFGRAITVDELPTAAGKDVARPSAATATYRSPNAYLVGSRGPLHLKRSATLRLSASRHVRASTYHATNVQ